MLEDFLVLYCINSLAQEVGFHFVFEKVSRFQISSGFWDIIPDLCTEVRKILV